MVVQGQSVQLSIYIVHWFPDNLVQKYAVLSHEFQYNHIPSYNICIGYLLKPARIIAHDAVPITLSVLLFLTVSQVVASRADSNM